MGHENDLIMEEVMWCKRCEHAEQGHDLVIGGVKICRYVNVIGDTGVLCGCDIFVKKEDGKNAI